MVVTTLRHLEQICESLNRQAAVVAAPYWDCSPAVCPTFPRFALGSTGAEWIEHEQSPSLFAQRLSFQAPLHESAVRLVHENVPGALFSV